MAHRLYPISAKVTFGTLQENLYQSDYLIRKKSRLAFCNNPSYCNKIKLANNYKEYNLYNVGRYVKTLDTCNIIPVSNDNLITSQYSKLDLQDICTVKNGAPPTIPIDGEICKTDVPVTINPNDTNPFYYSNTIDPVGALFGNSQCGELNYTQYTVFYK